MLDKSINHEYEQQQDALQCDGGVEPVFAIGETDFQPMLTPFEVKANDRQHIEHYCQQEADDDELGLMKSKEVEWRLKEGRGYIIIHCF